MFHSAIIANTYKRSVYTLLSAVLLLARIPSVSAFNHSDLQVTTLKTDAYHCKGSQTKSAHSKEHIRQQRIMKCMLTQLQYFQQNDKTIRQQYFAYKAQAWLNYAIHKNSMNSRSSTGLKAAQTANTILLALKEGTEQDLPLIQNIPSDSALMRPDLWATLSALKESDGLTSAPREIAFSEVALIWAATDHCERGRHDSASHFRMADRWLEQAREAYINTHDSQTNVALENLIVHYYEQYTPLDASDNVCRGQILIPPL